MCLPKKAGVDSRVWVKEICSYSTIYVDVQNKGSFTNYVDKILAFFDHLPPCVDIFYGITVDKKWTFLDHLPTSACKCSLRPTPYLDILSKIKKVIKRLYWLYLFSILHYILRYGRVVYSTLAGALWYSCLSSKGGHHLIGFPLQNDTYLFN